MDSSPKGRFFEQLLAFLETLAGLMATAVNHETGNPQQPLFLLKSRFKSTL